MWTMEAMPYRLLFIVLLAIFALVSGCTAGKKLPASWPEIGITLPNDAQVIKLDKAFRLYTHDGSHAYKQDGREEFWALCFTCPGGISQAYDHIDPGLLRSGFKEVAPEEYPHAIVSRIAGKRKSTYCWTTESQRTGVTLLMLDDQAHESPEDTGGLCLVISIRDATTARDSTANKADSRCF